MTNIIKVNTASPLEKVASYSRLIVVDNWIYVSNTAGRNPETKLIPDDLIEQTEQVFSNIEKALKVVNASLQDVVMSRVFIQNPADTHQVMEYIGTKFKGVNPATTVTNPSLGSQAYKVELEVTAYRGAGNSTVQQISI
ncbi:Rid family hydrolase [Psychromonas sp. GE-S-Ul-11]|uniref:Rid family hydrolase n=1 Tax=Psychromonas sp. GE-S-Ul-11 TaxID=3241170 RepID=UPI00390C813D